MFIKKRKYETCVCCGKPITTGRKDRKFCDLSCKNTYNNYHHEFDSFSVVKSRTMRILTRNYSILQDVVGSKMSSVDLGDLVAVGFNPDFSTSYRRCKGGDERRCFDIKYRQSGMRVYNIKPVLNGIAQDAD